MSGRAIPGRNEAPPPRCCVSRIPRLPVGETWVSLRTPFHGQDGASEQELSFPDLRAADRCSRTNPFLHEPQTIKMPSLQILLRYKL